MFWGRAEIDALRALADAGLSASEVAKQIGATRNAVIGKASREGVSWARMPKSKYTLQEITIIRRRRLEKQAERMRRHRSEVLHTQTLVEPAPQGDVALGCRWLHGEAVKRNFCGADVHSHSASWCPFHMNLVFSRVAVNKREAA